MTILLKPHHPTILVTHAIIETPTYYDNFMYKAVSAIVKF